MAQISLHSLDVVTVLQGEDSVCMPHVVHPCFGRTNLGSQLIEVVIECVGAKMGTVERSEHQIVPALFFITGIRYDRTANFYTDDVGQGMSFEEVDCTIVSACSAKSRGSTWKAKVEADFKHSKK